MSAGRVVITDSDLGAPDIERAIVEGAGYELLVADARSEAEVVAAAAGASGLLVQYARVGREVFETVPTVRAVVRYGTGLDTVDLDAARAAGVAVRGVPGFCTDEVADHTMALLLAVVRGITGAAAAVRAGGWPLPDDLGGVRALSGARLGIVGFGTIGRAVARRALAFGMQVVAYDPAVDADAMAELGVTAATIDDTFRSDVVSLHLPATDETRGLVGRSLLDVMPPRSVLLNVARGALVDEAALLDALARGRPAHAALDVLAEEPPGADHPLVRHPHVLVTPHVAYYSPASLERLRTRAAEQLVALLQEPRRPTPSPAG